MTYLLRVVTAGNQVDTEFDSEDAVLEAFYKCKDLAMVFCDGTLFAYNFEHGV